MASVYSLSLLPETKSYQPFPAQAGRPRSRCHNEACAQYANPRVHHPRIPPHCPLQQSRPGPADCARLSYSPLHRLRHTESPHLRLGRSIAVSYPMLSGL